jgi:hypothetical protein
LKLFEKVAASLSMEHLEWAVKQYVSMAFYAGKSISLLIIGCFSNDFYRSY